MTEEQRQARGRELLALRLYGELDPAEEQELDRALAESAALRAFAEELAAGLGALVPAAQATAELDLPAERPRGAEAWTAPPPARRPRRAGALVAFAAGLAAGVALARSFSGGDAHPERAQDSLRYTTNAPTGRSQVAYGDGLRLGEPPLRATGSAFASLGGRMP